MTPRRRPGGVRGRSIAAGLLLVLAWHGAAPAALAQAPAVASSPATPGAAAPEPAGAAELLLDLARRFEARGEDRAAGLLCEEIVARYPGTAAAAAAAAMLASLGERGAAGGPAAPARLDQSGRGQIVVWSTLLAAWSAVSIPIAADADEPPAYGAALLAGPAIGLFASLRATRGRPISAAQGDIFMQGVLLGAGHGVALGLLEDWESGDVALAAAAGGLAGAGVATLLIAPGKNRESSAALSGLATFHGAWLGLVTALAVAGDEGGDSDDAVAAMVAGADLALAGSLVAMKQVTLSRARGRLVWLGGVAGAMAGGGTILLLDEEGAGTTWTIVGIGTLAGLAGGVFLTRDYDRARGFTDPPRAGRDDGAGFELLALRPGLQATLPGARTPRQRERLAEQGIRATPTVTLSLLDWRF